MLRLNTPQKENPDIGNNNPSSPNLSFRERSVDFAAILARILPAVELFFVVIPIVVFGMFSMGLSPDDPFLRAGYYSLVLGVVPTAFILGTIFTRFKLAQKITFMLDIAGGVVGILCFLWFFAKISLVPLEFPTEYVGWDWREHYQLYLLIILTGILACRVGFIPLEMSRFHLPRTELQGPLTLCAAILAGQYLLGWFAGSWPLIFLDFAFLEMGGGLLEIGVDSTMSQRKDVPTTLGESGTTIPMRVVKVAMPIMILGEGCSLGLIYITSAWNGTWMGNLALSLGVAAGLVGLIWVMERKEKWVLINKWLPLISACILSALVLFLWTNWVQPMDLIWVILNGGILGVLIQLEIRIYLSLKHQFLGALRILAFGMIGLIGIAGGLAYFLYQPQGNGIVSWVMLGCATAALCLTFLSVLFQKK
ncbi:MAG TPA: hypothetical protein VKK79_07450 [Candidatus Lokiarchaeia archaeon]|nr:hypothetical protein [Candidatus Lokiarchaeia archaeon]